MEEELEVLGTALSNLETTVLKPSDYEDLYKNWGKVGSQEERRKELLNVQKSNRINKIDKLRGILDLVTAVEENDLFRSEAKVSYRPSIYVAGFNKTSPSYRNIMMLSEWLIEKPEDFEENWCLIPCPKAMRTLIVTNNGITKFYTKYGHFKFQCRTALPGGNPYGSRKACCVLDGFYHEQGNTVYIIDVLAWNNQPMADGETEFRHFWLKNQLLEIPELKLIDKKNEVCFEMLPVVSCTRDAISEFLKKYPIFDDNTPVLDGILFYHKRANYVSGETPLVGWLFPYMIPEVLGDDIKINSEYIAERPENYVNQAEFIKSFEAKYSKKKNKNNTKTGMEVEITQAEVETVTSNEESKTNNNECMDADEVKTEKSIST